jgi:hypothetical protein
VFDDFQVTFLFVALEGDTVAVRVVLLPSFKDSNVLLRETPVGRVAAFTVTVQVAVIPFAVVTVIVAVPALTAVTFPLFTVATALSDEVQVILFTAFEGETVAVRVA